MNGNVPPAQYYPPEWDLLLSAAQKDLPDQIHDLVRNQGVDPSHANAVKQSALHIAALWGHVDAVQALLEEGADVNAQNRLSSATPLHMVVQTRKCSPGQTLAVVRLLVDVGGADISQPDGFGRLPVDYCGDGDDKPSDHGDADAAAWKAIADKLRPQAPAIFAAIEARDVDRARRELQLMASSSSSVNEGVDAGAGGSSSSIAESTFRGKSPLLLTVTEMLREVQGTTGDDDGSEQQQQREDSCHKLFSILCCLVEEAGADTNATALLAGDDDDGEDYGIPGARSDPMLFQICSTMREICPSSRQQQQSEEEDPSSSWQWELLSKTAVTFVEKGGATMTTETTQLLHTAARKNQVAMVAFLIERLGVDVNVAGRQGMTALQFAARAGQIDVVQYLLQQHGAAIDVHAGSGNTALVAARINNKTEVVTAIQTYIEQQLAAAPRTETSAVDQEWEVVAPVAQP